MKKLPLVSFLVLSLALFATLPALVKGAEAPPSGAGSGSGGKSTPTPTATATPVVGDDDCDGALEGCLGDLFFLFDGGEHHHHFGFNDRDRRDRD